MTHQDILQRFIFDGAPVRGALVRLDAAWQQVLARRSYPAPLERLLGEMMAASSLLSANLKFEGTLVMQLQGQGALQLAVVESNSDRTLRATARWDGDSLPDVPVKELLGTGGVCVITLTRSRARRGKASWRSKAIAWRRCWSTTWPVRSRLIPG